MRKFVALFATLMFSVVLGVAGPAVASRPSAPSAAAASPATCSWTDWRVYTDDIATGGYSHFYGTVYYKTQLCDGAKTRTKVGTFYVTQKITAQSYPGIKHSIQSARQIKNDQSNPAWIDSTDHSCTGVCDIVVIYNIQNIIPFDPDNQVTVYCRACNAGGIGGETSIMYYMRHQITCEGTGLSCG